MYLAMSLPGSLFIVLTVILFEVMLLGRMTTTSTRKEQVLILSAGAAFAAAGMPIFINPDFSFGRWDFLVFMTLLTLAFITAGYLPVRKIEMLQYGVATAFVVSFFYEMFGFPLTIFIIDVVLEKQLPLSGFPALKEAHLWVTMGLMDYSSAHLLSGLVIIVGVVLVMTGHLALYTQKGRIVASGIYRYLKHPQYIGIIVISGGMLIEYPTLFGLILWAVLVAMYTQRARLESREIALKRTGASDPKSKPYLSSNG
jgi:protein-S-isoprenylcysteine O-methyltransferase Ste14